MTQTQVRLLLTALGTAMGAFGVASFPHDVLSRYLIVAFLGGIIFACLSRSWWGIVAVPTGYAIGITFEEAVVQGGADMSLIEAALTVLAAAIGAAITTTILAIRQRKHEPMA